MFLLQGVNMYQIRTLPVLLGLQNRGKFNAPAHSKYEQT